MTRDEAIRELEMMARSIHAEYYITSKDVDALTMALADMRRLEELGPMLARIEQGLPRRRREE